MNSPTIWIVSQRGHLRIFYVCIEISIDITNIYKVNRSLIYVSIKDLIKKKYATKDWDITDSGSLKTRHSRMIQQKSTATNI